MFIFGAFSNKHHYNFNNKYMWKMMSIQYTVPGFEPTTFGTWVSSQPYTSSQSFKASTLINYDSGIVSISNLLVITSLEM